MIEDEIDSIIESILAEEADDMVVGKIEKEHSEPRLSFSERSLNTNSVIEVQKEAINLSLCLHVLLQLKQYLQAKFKISEEQHLSYTQAEKQKKNGPNVSFSRNT